MKKLRSVSVEHATAVAYTRVHSGIKRITENIFAGSNSWLLQIDLSRLSLVCGSSGRDWIPGQIGLTPEQLIEKFGWTAKGNDTYLALVSVGIHFLDPSDLIIVSHYPQDPDSVTEEILLHVWKDVISKERNTLCDHNNV